MKKNTYSNIINTIDRMETNTSKFQSILEKLFILTPKRKEKPVTK